MTKNTKKSKKAAQDAAKKRTLTITGILLLAIVAIAWISASVQKNTVVVPYPTAEKAVAPKKKPMPPGKPLNADAESQAEDAPQTATKNKKLLISPRR